MMKISSSSITLFFTSIPTVCSWDSTTARKLNEAPPIDKNNCAEIDELGTNDLDRYKYSVSMEQNNHRDGSHTLSIQMQHDETLPIAQDHYAQCNFLDPVIAPEDGLPYFAFRRAYQSLPQNMKEATGIDHIGIDFNSCGHQPWGRFLEPHYDIHFFMVDPEYRRCMTCDTKTEPENSPICDPEPGSQSTLSGRGFFVANTILHEDGDHFGKPANMPENFKIILGGAIPFMGGYSLAYGIAGPPTIPPGRHGPGAQNVEPHLSMGYYNGGIIRYSFHFPMLSLNGSPGERTSLLLDESMSYLGHTNPYLPSLISALYVEGTKTLLTEITVPSQPPTVIGGKKGSKSRKYRNK